MKLNNLLYVFISFLFFSSCSGMNDIIQEYLDRGEINYIGKTDSIYSIGGKERITFKWLVNADPRIENLILEWRDGDEFHKYETKVDRSVKDEKGYVVHHVAMPEFEGTFVFKAYHTGTLGYQSVPSEVTGAVYAERYQKSLKTRFFRRISMENDKAVVSWELADKSLAEKVEYTDKEGRKHVVDVKTKDTDTELPNAKPGSEIILRSLFVPEPVSKIVNKKEVFSWYEEDEFWTERKLTLPAQAGQSFTPSDIH